MFLAKALGPGVTSTQFLPFLSNLESLCIMSHLSPVLIFHLHFILWAGCTPSVFSFIPSTILFEIPANRDLPFEILPSVSCSTDEETEAGRGTPIEPANK